MRNVGAGAPVATCAPNSCHTHHGLKCLHLPLPPFRIVWTEPVEGCAAAMLPAALALAPDWTERTQQLREALAAGLKRGKAGSCSKKAAQQPAGGHHAGAAGTGATLAASAATAATAPTAAIASAAAAAFLASPEHQAALLVLLDDVSAGQEQLGHAAWCHLARRCGVVDLLGEVAMAGGKAPSPPAGAAAAAQVRLSLHHRLPGSPACQPACQPFRLACLPAACQLHCVLLLSQAQTLFKLWPGFGVLPVACRHAQSHCCYACWMIHPTATTCWLPA